MILALLKSATAAEHRRVESAMPSLRELACPEGYAWSLRAMHRFFLAWEAPVFEALACADDRLTLTEISGAGASVQVTNNASVPSTGLTIGTAVLGVAKAAGSLTVSWSPVSNPGALSVIPDSVFRGTILPLAYNASDPAAAVCPNAVYALAAMLRSSFDVVELAADEPEPWRPLTRHAELDSGEPVRIRVLACDDHPTD